MTPEQRLDQIERLMATAARNLNENTRQINENTQGLASLRASQQQTDEHMRRLSDIFVDTIRVIGQMQSEIQEIRTEIRGLQRENQRILDYLFGERRDNPPENPN